MFHNQCVSVTDLRTKTKECLQDLDEEPKYIFMNNRPIAVLLDIAVYEKYFLKPELIELEEAVIDDTLKKEAAKARKSKKSELINIH